MQEQKARYLLESSTAAVPRSYPSLVVQHATGVRVGNDAAKVCGCVVADAGAKNDGLGIPLVVQLEHLGKREGAADIGVEDEEAIRSTLQDLVAEVV